MCVEQGQSITVYINTGREQGCSVREWVVKQQRPELMWMEPIPVLSDEDACNPIKGFDGIVYDRLEPEGLALAEARLFYRDKLMTVVADGCHGCRWVKVSETNEDDDAVAEEVRQRKVEVYLRRDMQRFGLAQIKQEKLKVVEYHQNGQVIAWRIEKGE